MFRVCAVLRSVEKEPLKPQLVLLLLRLSRHLAKSLTSPQDTGGDEGPSGGSSRSRDQQGSDKRANSNTANLSRPDARCSDRVMGNLRREREQRGLDPWDAAVPRAHPSLSSFLVFFFLLSRSFLSLSSQLGKIGVSHVRWSPSSLNQTHSLL